MFRSLCILMMTTTPVLAQHQNSSSVPTEPGQSSFAAMAEIVAILRSDPGTDWSLVNISALQAHLVDMDLLATAATSVATPTQTGARFDVTGDVATIAALQRMVPAHAPFLEAETAWATQVETTDAGVSMTVSGDPTTIQALGFYGVMTIGAHHQEHHWTMATGASPHH